MAGDYEIPRVQDKELNEAILNCDISLDFLPFIELCHRYYADEIDWSVDETPRHTIARDKFQGVLMELLLPIHLVSEMGGVQVNVKAAEMASDTPDQQHSSWSVEFLAKNGTRHAISWKTRRTWIAGKIVAEHLYDQRHEGQVIQYSDLVLKRFDPDYFPDHL